MCTGKNRLPLVQRLAVKVSDCGSLDILEWVLADITDE
jgi:hypothetical protein